METLIYGFKCSAKKKISEESPSLNSSAKWSECSEILSMRNVVKRSVLTLKK
jgi:hypothetical protein